MTKKTPMRIRFWLKSPISPDRTVGTRASERWTSGSRCRSSRWRCQATKPQMQRGAGGHDVEGEGEAEDRDRRVLGLEPAPGARLEDSEDEEPESGCREHRADVVELGSGARAQRIADLRGHDQDEGDEHHLADEDDAPGDVRRRPPAENRANGDTRPGDAADDGVGDLAAGTLEVAGDQSGKRGKDERGTDPFEHRPAERQGRRPTAKAAVRAEPHA